MGFDWEAFDKLDEKTQLERFRQLLENNDREWIQKNNEELNKRFRFANKFIFLDILPEGFYKRGFLAVDVTTHQQVALLLLKPEDSRTRPFPLELSNSKMYYRECAVSYKLKHPNIVEHYESGIFENQAYIAYKFEESTNLENIILHSTTLKEINPLSFLIPISRALGFIHERKFTHGDVKPSNIIVTKEGAVRLGDFGTVRKIGEKIKIFGSISYTAPEILEGKPPTPAADIWSLGVVGYYLAHRELPFKVEPEDWPDKLIEQILTVEPKYTKRSRYLKDFLEKDPNKRLHNGHASRKILEWRRTHPILSKFIDLLYI
ncbi:serine/threonine protein kinase [Candidatus Woesearchaeota archaeon]|nr:serine/threonine protein kinase [Candidatus Woesearchaeota archaeon]